MAFLDTMVEILRRHYDALLQIPRDDGIIFTHAAREGNDQTRTAMTLAHLKQFRMHDFPLWPAEMVPHGNNGYALFPHDAEEREFMHTVFVPYAMKLKGRVDKGLCVVAGNWAAWFLTPIFFEQMCGKLDVIKHPCVWFRDHEEPFVVLKNLSTKVGGGFFQSKEVFKQVLGEVYSEQRCAWWASLTEEQRDEISEQRRARWASLTEEQRDEISEQRRKQALEWWATLPQEHHDSICDKHKVRWANWTEAEKDAIFQKAKTTREAWSEEEWLSFRDNIAAAKNATSPEAKAAIIEKYKATMATKTEDERVERCRKISEARLNRTDEELAEARRKMAETNAVARTAEAQALRLRFEAGELTIEEKRNIIKNGKERRKYREEHPGTAVCAAMEALFEEVQLAMEAGEHSDNLERMHSKQKAELLQKTLDQRAKFEAGLLSKEEEDHIIMNGKARAKVREDSGSEVFCPDAEELYRDVVQRRDQRREETKWSKEAETAAGRDAYYTAIAVQQMALLKEGKLDEATMEQIVKNGETREYNRKRKAETSTCPALEALYQAVKLEQDEQLTRKAETDLLRLAAKELTNEEKKAVKKPGKHRPNAAQEKLYKAIMDEEMSQKAVDLLQRFLAGELSQNERWNIKRIKWDMENKDVKKLFEAIGSTSRSSASSSSR
jgi:hypothetical protein